ncbi:UDP-glucose:glycoprotein glucosyltransferase 2 [Leptonychotes weddellii]|uniref:UDP-glucose ceramide glucosyltransferase-like 1 n=1 Tax=Leptonychotes weddellii TaxID=9713 RepID=A0A7F8QU96_LEPWE|nr:UDP-glucose:glycoprotein glucosyltransferase 2 [Leptonychotes weddellii]
MAKAADVVRLLLGSTALCFSLLGARTASASKAVTAHLAAKWPETPLLLEASEFMAEESNEKFWQFLETVQELAIYKRTESAYSHYNLILKKAGQFLDNLHINLLKFAFSIRAYSPTIQMFQQIAADEPPPDGCDAFVVIHKKHTCKINELKKLLKKATSRPRPYLFKDDHKFPTNKENLPVTILYAEIGTRAFSKFHKVLSDKAQNGEILYVLRHYIQVWFYPRLFCNVTIERYSDLRDNLTAFQKYLIESNKEMTPLKVWELQDLSFQAASQIMSTPIYDAVKLMKDISQNFPVKARSLTRIAVNQLMREEIQENQKMYQKVKNDNMLTVDNVKSVLLNLFPDANIWDILGIHSKYDNDRKDDVISSVTLWIIADFDKPSGRKLLFNALKFMKTSVHSRLGVIYNPTSKINEENTAISRGVLAAFLTQKNSFLRNFLRKLAKEETATAIYSGEKIKTFLTEGMDKNAFEKKYSTVGVNIFQTHQLFCQDVLKLRPGEIGIVSNGKFLGPLDENFYTEDFYFLEKITFTNLVEKIEGIVENMEISSKNMSDLVMKADALLSSLPKRASRHDITFLRENHSIITINPEENDMFFDVIAIVDPLTREAQKMAQLLIVLGKIINMKIKLFMNCRGKLSEAPLKSFYRFVLEPELVLVANGITGPVATFLDIPEAPLLTLNMITPEGWLVETVHSNCDLDNIHLKDIERIVTAEYELEYLLLEGHCFDTMTEQPPRGLQFTLGTKNKPVVVDTIVMANLGYFQLKANPGAWILKLREGKSEDIYQIVGHEGTDSQPDQGDVIVVINSFKSKILEVQVQKKPDKIKEDILTDKEEKKKGIWDSIKSFTRSLHKEKDEKEADVLNIFSVASGHLYERFLRIMMLSVLRNTKTPVKFWFLKNYLSPTFKEVIPPMAEEYGFQYELVQYRWPSWLHQQTEKQRIIWGYKILFLDVLFPLAVDKIIFVDADQIVRHDLKELRDFDLGGAPYGYTPFCDSRTEMDGYRFWKKGYWASHLLRRKYHISALYVVDLKKFRRIAAGDRLRGQYQALSQDPNSLSNLDQDLPNNMIYQVAIKSLPQDWLWCETWCDDDSKQRAKTIDLCNNPKTKEPKLKAAARIVPEWVEYDTEIRQLLDHLENKKKNAIVTHDEL